MSSISHTSGQFVLDYTGYIMNYATCNGVDLRYQLLDIISRNALLEMDQISKQIFDLIKKLDSNQELSIALTNYYFESFWWYCMTLLSQENIRAAEKILIWSCEITWKQEEIHGHKFHKGTPYFFLGMCYMLGGNIDLGFQMIHLGHEENLRVYPLLKLDYKSAPSYLFMTLNANDPHNAMHSWVLAMKGKIDGFIDMHNQLSLNHFSYDIFDKKFLQRINKVFDETKFFLVYLLMNLLNLESFDKEPLNQNPFSNIRKIELMFDLCLIVDKTLAENFRTRFISDGVIEYFVQILSMNENWKKKIKEVLSYSDGTPFNVNGDPEDVVTKLLNNEVYYKGKSISYEMKCMLAAWNLRNFSAHNLRGIENLLGNKSQPIFALLFSAMFLAAEIL